MSYIKRHNEFTGVYNDIDTYPTLEDVARHLGVSVKRVKNRAGEVRALIKGGVEGLNPIISRKDKTRERAPRTDGVEIAELPSVAEPIEDMLERLMRHNEELAKLNGAKALIDVQIPEAGWFGIAGIPDQHLNNPGTHLRQAFDDARLIAATDGVYAVSIGDTLDNFIIGRLERERRKDVMSHEQAWEIQEHYFEILAHKLVIAIGGNHNDWIKKLSGIDILKRQIDDLGLSSIYDPVQLRIRLKTAGESFVHFARHGFPGRSKYHCTHGMLVWALERWEGEDVFWGGHIHTSGHMLIERSHLGHSRPVHLVQLSTYKKHDGYAIEGGFRLNDPFTCPLVVHNARTRETLFFDDLRRGVKMLQHLRETDPA